VADVSGKINALYQALATHEDTGVALRKIVGSALGIQSTYVVLGLRVPQAVNNVRGLTCTSPSVLRLDLLDQARHRGFGLSLDGIISRTCGARFAALAMRTAICPSSPPAAADLRRVGSRSRVWPADDAARQARPGQEACASATLH